MTSRWPLHPPPEAGEALTSWLYRLGKAYGLSVPDLIRCNLAPPETDPADYATTALDLHPPSWCLPALASRTGLTVEQLHQMTIAGRAPYLIGPRASEPAPDAGPSLDRHHDAVMLTTKKRPLRAPRDGRGWLPIDPRRGPMRRACPACQATAVDGDAALTLVSQLPLTLTCPQHSCYLEPIIGGRGGFIAWEEQGTDARAAPPSVVVMDARTEEAIRTGTVRLPCGSVVAQEWFQLLRTLICELSAPLSTLRAQSRRNAEHVWGTCGHPIRGGIVGARRPYETLPWDRQQLFLSAAATAMHLIEVREITTDGTLGTLLLPALRPRDSWRELTNTMQQAVASALDDSNAARQLLSALTALSSTEASFRHMRNSLVDAGIPEHFLPPALEDQQPATGTNSQR